MNERKTDWSVIIAIWTIAAAQIFLTLGNRHVGKVNQTYVRSTNCFAATAPDKRTPAHVKRCYDLAEQATGVKVERYGDYR